jgi:SET domain-containing protein
MLRVKTKLGNSSLHGIGLFADEFIPKGTITWQYDPEFDTAFTHDQIYRMPSAAKTIFWHYAYLDKELDKFILCSDDQRFINHKDVDFNIKSTTKIDVANRDINIGEELICNYNGFEDGYFDRRDIDVSKFN